MEKEGVHEIMLSTPIAFCLLSQLAVYHCLPLLFFIQTYSVIIYYVLDLCCPIPEPLATCGYLNFKLKLNTI